MRIFDDVLEWVEGSGKLLSPKWRRQQQKMPVIRIRKEKRRPKVRESRHRPVTKTNIHSQAYAATVTPLFRKKLSNWMAIYDVQKYRTDRSCSGLCTCMLAKRPPKSPREENKRNGKKSQGNCRKRQRVQCEQTVNIGRNTSRQSFIRLPMPRQKTTRGEKSRQEEQIATRWTCGWCKATAYEDKVYKLS